MNKDSKEYSYVFERFPWCLSCWHRHNAAWEWQYGGDLNIGDEWRGKCSSCGDPMVVIVDPMGYLTRIPKRLKL